MSTDLSATRLAQVRHELSRVIVGQDRVVDRLLVAVLAGGHVLLEGAPGLGKTLLLASLARKLSVRRSGRPTVSVLCSFSA